MHRLYTGEQGAKVIHRAGEQGRELAKVIHRLAGVGELAKVIHRLRGCGLGAKVIHRLGEQVGAAKVIHRSRACGGQVGGVQVRGVWAGNLKLFSQTP